MTIAIGNRDDTRASKEARHPRGSETTEGSLSVLFVLYEILHCMQNNERFSPLVREDDETAGGFVLY